MCYTDVQDNDKLTKQEKAAIHSNNYDDNNPRLANMTREQRIKAASFFGPNWASVVCGLGDQ